MMDEFLTPAEIKRLAGCAGREAQAEALVELGVPFRKNGKGDLIVSRELSRRWTCGEQFRASSGPRLDLVR
jgi:hypothetical protein